MAERSIPANTHEAHTIALHGLIHDMREVLDMCSMAWFVVAFVIGLDALEATLDRAWLLAAFLTGPTGFAIWTALDFRRRGRKYRTRRYERAHPAEQPERGES